jgi:hypothetical protein
VKELLETSHEQLAQGGDHIAAAMLGFIVVSIFGDSKEYGNLWSEKNDNELLGIEEKSAAELKDLFAEL